MTAPTLYRILDEYPWLEREDEYSGLTLAEAAIRMDDLTGCGEDVILSDFDEGCTACDGHGWQQGLPGERRKCVACHGDCKRREPWNWEDDETSRTVTMMREVG
jgi:hypothetical protein